MHRRRNDLATVCRLRAQVAEAFAVCNPLPHLVGQKSVSQNAGRNLKSAVVQSAMAAQKRVGTIASQRLD